MIATINNYDFLSLFWSSLPRAFMVKLLKRYFYHIEVHYSMHYIFRNNLNPQIQQGTLRIWTIKNLKIVWCKLTVTITIPFVAYTKNNSFFNKYNIWNIFFISPWIQIVIWALCFNHLDFKYCWYIVHCWICYFSTTQTFWNM